MGLIIGYHGAVVNSQPLIINHKGTIGYDIDWLLQDHAGREYKKVAYDLDYLAAIILKTMEFNKDNAEKLLEQGKLHYYYNNSAYDIMYFPSKYFSVSKGAGYNRPYAGFYNAEQYLAASHYELNPNIADCLSKALEARDTAVQTSQAFFKLGLDPDTLTSPVRSMERSLLRNVSAPTHLDIPPEVNDMALKSCTGSWVEAYQLGHFEKAYDLDITGAYASILANLYDLRHGDWVQEPVMPSEAVYGFATGEANITAKFHPIIYKKSDTSNYTPTGSCEVCLTKEKIDFIKDYSLGKFNIADGWWWIPKGNQTQPYKGIVNFLYNKRATANPLEDKSLKRCLAGLWGRTLHTHYEKGQLIYGDAFNPVYGSIVENNTHIEVAKMVLENELYPRHLIHIAVDGIITGRLPTLSAGNGLGKWRLSHTGKALVINSGVAAVEGKSGAEDFAINYDWLISAIAKEPLANSYTMRKVSPVTLARGIDKLGELEEISREINIGQDGKRLYLDTPVCGQDLMDNHYTSEPLDIAQLL